MKYGPYSIDEKDAAQYQLPDPLETADGKRITTAAEWMNFRRPEILELFMKYEYGEILPRPDSLRFELLTEKNDALEGSAVRREVKICCSMRNGREFSFTILVYIPKNRTAPSPVFVGLNFKGNHNTTRETDVIPTGYRFPGQLCEPERGVQYSRWIPDELVRQGFASVTACYHDIFPDRADGADDSALQLFADGSGNLPRIGEKYSVIGVWAWGLSRMLDYVESDPLLDARRAAVHGHSRLGKTSLWAGAADPRFQMVISNCSGCGGGALHKRKIGENLSQHFQAHLGIGYPPWFMDETEKFIFREEDLPIDQHELLALIAPRPLAIGTATLDFNADPKGEFLACRAASEVYGLFGSAGLPVETMPEPDRNISGDISFHYTTGPHDQTPADWAHYLELARTFFHRES